MAYREEGYVQYCLHSRRGDAHSSKLHGSSAEYVTICHQKVVGSISVGGSTSVICLVSSKTNDQLNNSDDMPVCACLSDNLVRETLPYRVTNGIGCPVSSKRVGAVCCEPVMTSPLAWFSSLWLCASTLFASIRRSIMCANESAKKGQEEGYCMDGCRVAHVLREFIRDQGPPPRRSSPRTAKMLLTECPWFLAVKVHCTTRIAHVHNKNKPECKNHLS